MSHRSGGNGERIMNIDYKKTIVKQKVNGQVIKTEVLIPDIEIPDQTPVGSWGLRHLDYIKKNHKSRYNELLVMGALNSYLSNIDAEAKTMLAYLTERMKAAEGVSETLKAMDQMEWVRRMNSITNRADEIVLAEIVYSL